MIKLLENIGTVLLAKEKKQLYSFILLDVFISIADIFSMALLVLTISYYTGTVNAHPVFMNRFKDTPRLLLPLLLLIFFVVKNTASYITQKLRYKLVYTIASRLSTKNLEAYLSAGYETFTETDSANHIRNINHQPIEFCNYVLLGVQQILTEIFLILFAVIALLIFDAKLFILLLPVLLPAIIVLLFILKKRSKKIRTKIQQANVDTLQYLTEAINGYIESNIYNRNEFFIQRYGNSQQALNRQLIDMQLMQKISPVVMELFAVAGLVMLIIFNQSTGNATDTILLGAFIAAAYKIIPGIARIINTAALVKTFEYTVNDLLRSTKKLAIIQQNTAPIASIQFRDTSFYYKDKPILNQLNFTLSAGKITAVTGSSGIGKTTVINLLLGFLKQRSGEILINNINCDASQRMAFWEKVAYVKQQNFLLHASVKTNIILGDEHIDRVRLEKVIAMTGLDAFLHTMPAGIETIIAEGGKNISGGQRQRIAIARALYKDADLVILDEPFNELDEYAISQLMILFKDQAKKGKAILLVSHNTEAIKLCDAVISI